MSHDKADGFSDIRTPNRILIADGSGPSGAVAHALEARGVEVVMGGELDEALVLFHRRDYPVVFVWVDGDGTGYEMVGRARVKKDTAFVAFTAGGSLEGAVRALRMGFRDYIEWPRDESLLADRVGRLFAEVQAARFREDMMCMITHDIKIPLSSILGYGALLVDKNTNQVHVRAREFAKIIQGNALRIQALIDNFLTTCKIDSGKLYVCYREVNLRRLLEDVVETFLVEAERHNLKLVAELDDNVPDLGGDESLLFRAVGNMVSNACKFTPAGGAIVIGLKHLTGGDKGPLGRDCVHIFVSNPGGGLSREDLDSVFERFHRGEGHGGAEGSGLGAFVMKSIVEAHGGEVRAESAPNQLTTFSAYLPLKLPFNAEDR